MDYGGLRINLFVSHFHANYNPLSDQYRGHRTVQAVEAAQWIKLASASADLTLYAGDFNVRPDEIPYQENRAFYCTYQIIGCLCRWCVTLSRCGTAGWR